MPYSSCDILSIVDMCVTFKAFNLSFKTSIYKSIIPSINSIITNDSSMPHT